MVLIGQLSCQLKDIKQMAKIYSKFPSLPSFIKKSGPYFQISKNEGVRALTIYLVDEDKFDKAHDYLLERYEPFSGISSVSFAIERWENLKDALAILGSLGPSS